MKKSGCVLQEVAGHADDCALFVRATTILREATTLVESRPLRRSVLRAANQAHDEELGHVSRELRQSLEALKTISGARGPQTWVRR